MMSARKGILAAAVAVVAVVVVVILVASGDGGDDGANAANVSQGGAASGQEEVTLRLLMTTTAQAATEQLVADFEKANPTIDVEDEYLPTLTIEQVLPTQIQGGSAPDLSFVQTGNTSAIGVWRLGKEGHLLDLTGRPWDDLIWPAARATNSVDGKVYAWPSPVLPYDTVYNVDLFEELGLTFPETQAEVLEMCRTIRAAGKVPFIQSVEAMLQIARQRYAQFVYSVDPDWDQKRADGSEHFETSPLWHRALESLVEMKDADCFQPGVEGTTRPQQYAMMARGDGVFSLAHAFDLAAIREANPDVNLAMTNMPPDDGGDAALFTAASLAIAGISTTEHPEEVKAFIDFMASEDESSKFAETAGGIAPVDAMNGELPPYMNRLAPFVESEKLVGQHDAEWPNPRVVQDGLSKGIVGLFTGQLSVDEILANMDRIWDEGS